MNSGILLLNKSCLLSLSLCRSRLRPRHALGGHLGLPNRLRNALPSRHMLSLSRMGLWPVRYRPLVISTSEDVTRPPALVSDALHHCMENNPRLNPIVSTIDTNCSGWAPFFTFWALRLWSGEGAGVCERKPDGRCNEKILKSDSLGYRYACFPGTSSLVPFFCFSCSWVDLDWFFRYNNSHGSCPVYALPSLWSWNLWRSFAHLL